MLLPILNEQNTTTLSTDDDQESLTPNTTFNCSGLSLESVDSIPFASTPLANSNITSPSTSCHTDTESYGEEPDDDNIDEWVRSVVRIRNRS